MYIYTKVIDGQRVLYGTNNSIPSANDKALKYYGIDETEISSLSNFKLYYDVHRVLFGSTSNIPTNADTEIIPCIVNADNSLTPILGGFNAPTISLNKTTTTIDQGKTETLTATITPTNGTVSWASSGNAKVTVSDEGVVSVAADASTTDKATITATVTSLGGTASASCEVTVNAAEL